MVRCAQILAALALAIVSAGTPLAAQDVPVAASAAQAESRAADRAEPVTILISIDGFHPDYLTKGMTPTLTRLAAEGAAGPMRPSFPTKTFPNHWTLVTGLVPDQNGITANRIEDPERPGEIFTMANVDPWWWSDAKPIWVEAEAAGIRTANMFWPGSAVPWGGTQQRFGPVTDGSLSQDWIPFSMQVSNTQRVNVVLDWMRRPAAIRPKFVTLYFDVVDTAGHDAGIEGEAINTALRDVDAHIAMLADGLAQMGQSSNLVIVSDHGMAPTSSDRVIIIDDLLDVGTYRMVESGAYATFAATDGNVAAFEAKLLSDHPHMQCWRKSEIPARYQYGTHRRIPPYLCLPETGWTVMQSPRPGAWSGGAHGYDPFDPAMTALFIANGPAFHKGTSVAEFQNTAITPLLRALIGIGADQTALAPFQAALVSAE